MACLVALNVSLRYTTMSSSFSENNDSVTMSFRSFQSLLNCRRCATTFFATCEQIEMSKFCTAHVQRGSPRREPKTFSLDQYILCYTKYVHTSRVCDEKINSLVSFSFYSGRAMNTNEKREQKNSHEVCRACGDENRNHGPVTHSHALLFICIMSVFCQ